MVAKSSHFFEIKVCTDHEYEILFLLLIMHACGLFLILQSEYHIKKMANGIMQGIEPDFYVTKTAARIHHQGTIYCMLKVNELESMKYTV